MHLFFTGVLLSLTLRVCAGYLLDTFSVSGKSLFAYRLKAIAPREQTLLIFLHGSVKAFTANTESALPALTDLLEGNKSLEEQSAQSGIDMVVPIVNGTYNWLEPDGKVWIEALLERYSAQYTRIFIAGF